MTDLNLVCHVAANLSMVLCLLFYKTGNFTFTILAGISLLASIGFAIADHRSN